LPGTAAAGAGAGARTATGVRHRSAGTQGEAKRLLKAEHDRLEAGASYREPTTFREMADRYLASHHAQPNTITKLRHNLRMICTVIGDVQATDVTAERVERWLNSKSYSPSYRASIVAALRQVYSWGIRAQLVNENPGLGVARP
jgi:hypothetical protein